MLLSSYSWLYIGVTLQDTKIQYIFFFLYGVCTIMKPVICIPYNETPFEKDESVHKGLSKNLKVE